ncbi:FAST kinase domain-containing protein 1, mitochondrial-like isoform X2 [Tachypleus tridentatus]|uniref:FAST kinase domain-containing protein 1, mitochondrial-like isoform X2 n=1 Tax=Tachypleus tridentatus TaxID=6853 RepID=UPI003FD62B8F
MMPLLTFIRNVRLCTWLSVSVRSVCLIKTRPSVKVCNQWFYSSVVKQMLNTRPLYSKSKDFSETDDEFLEDLEDRDLHKTKLFPDSEDPFIDSIMSCQSVEELFMLMKTKEVRELTANQASQIIVTLWDLRKLLFRTNSEAFIEFNHQLHSNPYFHEVLQVIPRSYHLFSDEVVSNIFLALRRLGIPLDNFFMQDMMLECGKRCEHFDLPALSKFTVALEHSGNQALPFLSLVLSRVVQLLRHQCQEEDDLKRVAICLIHQLHLVSSNLIDLFAKSVQQFLKSGKITDHRILQKCLTVFTNTPYQHHYVTMIQELCNLLIPSVQKLNSLELAFVCNLAAKAECNTDPLIAVILSQVQMMLNNQPSPTSLLYLVQCLVFNHQIHDRKQQQELFTFCLQNVPFTFHAGALLRILFHLPTEDIQTLDTFWKLFAESIDSIKVHRLACRVYLLKQLSLSKPYSHKAFESVMKKWCYSELEKHGFLFCKDIALLGAFLISCSPEELPAWMYNKILNIMPQLSSGYTDFLALALNLLRKQSVRVKENVQKKLDLMKHGLNAVAKDQLKDAFSIRMLNRLLHTQLLLTPRYHLGNSLFIDDLMNKYHSYFKTFTPKVIEDTTKYLILVRFWLPEVVESMAREVVEKPDIFPASVISKLLFLCYTLSCFPEADSFLDKCSDIIIRYQNSITGLQVLQAGVALGLFEHLNSSLIHTIFSVSFLDKIDREITAQATATYSSRVRNLLMVLNRITCLDFPQQNVPWFHEKYCQDNLSKTFHKMSAFQHDVYNILCEVISGPQHVRAHVYTPYHYHLCFECVIDSKGQPLVCSDFACTMWGSTQNTDVRHAKVSSRVPDGCVRYISVCK